MRFLRYKFIRIFLEYDIFSPKETNLNPLWLSVLVLLHNNCVNLDNLLNLSMCLFLHLSRGDKNSTQFTGVYENGIR